MAKKITYLLGAGASALTMPTVAKFREAIFELERDLDKRNIVNEMLMKAPEITDTNGAASLVVKLSLLNKELINFSSIDTFARYIYFTQPKELTTLKALINFCFTYWHFQKGLDKRYDGLFSLLVLDNNGKPNLPGNVKFLTWNYDLQLESSIARYIGKKNLGQLEQVIPIFPCVDRNKTVKSDEFSVFKLNGSAQAFWNQTGNVFKNDLPFEFFNHDLTKEEQNRFNYLTRIVVQDYIENVKTSKGVSYISYSWENNENNQATRQGAKNLCVDTEVLVVIGYSFPLINRAIDEELLRSMKRLHKVYVQSPKETMEAVTERMKSVIDIDLNNPSNRIQIAQVRGSDEFCVPDEIFVK